jgi:hypothetical protein
MFRTLVDNRRVLSWAMACATGVALLRQWPFPADNDVLQLILLQKPWVFYFFRYGYTTMAFSTPLICFSSLFALLYIFAVKGERPLVRNALPPYPPPGQRQKLFLVLGELHHPKRTEPVENPKWLWIPEQGLFTGIAVFGAIGSGKTTCCMVPFAEQILSYRAGDPDRRASALVLEVKGDFCFKVRKLLEKYRRAEDYVEISLHGEYRYNPLYNDQDAYALAFGIASLLNNLFGRGKEPFWQQPAATDDLLLEAVLPRPERELFRSHGRRKELTHDTTPARKWRHRASGLDCPGPSDRDRPRHFTKTGRPVFS